MTGIARDRRDVTINGLFLSIPSGAREACFYSKQAANKREKCEYIAAGYTVILAVVVSGVFMTKSCRFFALSVLFASTLTSPQAQTTNLKVTADNLKDALVNLLKNPGDRAAQERYLHTFPRNYRNFIALFGPNGALEDGHEYILLLPSLAKEHETDLGSLLVGLSKDAEYEADAPSYLQHCTAQYASKYTRTFVKLAKRLPRKKRSNLVTFLSDEEAIAGDPQYQAIIDNLRKLGEYDLARAFESARTERARLVDH